MQFIIYAITTYILKVNTLDALRNNFPDSETRAYLRDCQKRESFLGAQTFWLNS